MNICNYFGKSDVSTGKSLTYSQLLSAMDRVASALVKRGFQPQDTVLFMSSNHVEFPVLFFAVWMLGGSNACLTLYLLPGTTSPSPSFDLLRQFNLNKLRSSWPAAWIISVQPVRSPSTLLDNYFKTVPCYSWYQGSSDPNSCQVYRDW